MRRWLDDRFEQKKHENRIGPISGELLFIVYHDYDYDEQTNKNKNKKHENVIRPIFGVTDVQS